MRGNKILKVVTLITKRYLSGIELTDAVIKDVSNTVYEVYGKDYITRDDIIAIVTLMSKYK